MKIFITGASSGIGKALALAYAKNSAASPVLIALAARRQDVLQELANELQTVPDVQCAIYQLDVKESHALDTAAKDFIQRFGVPDLVIACAGVSRGTLTEYQEDNAAFQEMMEINVLGMVHTFQPFITAMKSVGHGHLVGIASVAGIRGLPGAGAYSASKAAVINYLESLRAEMLLENIAVTTILPGYIRTPMTDANQFRMPFLMDADVFAKKFIHHVAAKRRVCVIPWQMGIVVKLMRMIPPALWDKLVKNAPQKSRIIEKR